MNESREGTDEKIPFARCLTIHRQANVAFLDEIWKSGPAILNTLLTITNEKKFHNENKIEDVPLQILLAASNELPKQKAGLANLAKFSKRRFNGGTDANPALEHSVKLLEENETRKNRDDALLFPRRKRETSPRTGKIFLCVQKQSLLRRTR